MDYDQLRRKSCMRLGGFNCGNGYAARFQFKVGVFAIFGIVHFTTMFEIIQILCIFAVTLQFFKKDIFHYHRN